MTPWARRRLLRMAGLWGPLVVISVLSFVSALVTWAYIVSNETPRERVARAARMGELERAEILSWKIVQKQPGDIEAWVRFVDMHTNVLGAAGEGESARTTAVNDASIRALLAKTGDSRVSTLATYWYEVSAVPATADPENAEAEKKPDAPKSEPAPVAALADAQPPARLANYILGRVAMVRDDWRVAARRFEREGLAFEKGRLRNLRGALGIWIRNDDWDEVRRRAGDKRYANAFDADVRLELAVHDRDWARVLLWVWPSGFVESEAWPIALALIAAILWFVIATRLGRIHDGVPGRRVLYLLSFVLGVVSIIPTLITILVEEEVFGLKQLGQFVPDAIYYVFGVGLREEAWKLILFLPLLPALLKRGSRIEAMTCGALVGLGFAAEENIGYFHHFGAAAALARFLTANFLHMSLTAIVALSVFDTMRGRATPSDGFSMVFPTAVIIHGAYDFFLTTQEVPLSSIISMMLFIIISRAFLRQLTIASSRAEEQGVLYLLIGSLSLITGASYVFATTLVGPWEAFRLIATGALGVAIVTYMFVRELSPQ